MKQTNLNHVIQQKDYLSEKEYLEISKLEELCYSTDKTNLKLELNYKMNLGKNPEQGSKKINEYLYYIEDSLVAYLGVSSFGANIGEINGMTHPDWRRKGLFKKLFEFALKECQNRHYQKLLLLTDGKSTSGMDFIKAVGGLYDFSEYRMKRLNRAPLESKNSISLRIAGKPDAREIARQNSIFFNFTDDIGEDIPFEEVTPNEVTYKSELNGEIIGKIKVKYRDNSAFISGVGILPNYRGKGYGKDTLKSVLNIIHEKGIHEIELDVECTNKNALNLYKDCGFEEKSIMNYFQYSTCDSRL